jgi:crotonobetaine/carnitine-CoA ligase
MDIMNTKHATIIGRNMNVRKLLERKVRQHADKPFVIFVDKNQREEILTYTQFDEQVNRLGNWLSKRGISKGEFVLTHLPNSTGFLVALHACTKIGAVMIPSIIFDVAEDLEYKLSFSLAKLVITDAEYISVFESIRAKCPALRDIVIYRSDKPVSGTHCWEEILSGSSPELAQVEIDPFDPAQMLFTSGTTARPKGVLLTHANFLYIGEICARSFAVTPGDRYLLVLPLFHVNAQCISYFPCLTAGASIVICEQFSASAFSTLLRKFDCSICSLVSAPVRMILAQPENPLDAENRLWRCPYAIAITDEEWDAFERRFGTRLIDLYGLTETLAPCAPSCPSGGSSGEARSAGPTSEWRSGSSTTSARKCRSGTWARSPSRASRGYRSSRSTTTTRRRRRETLSTDGSSRATTDGWTRTDMFTSSTERKTSSREVGRTSRRPR